VCDGVELEEAASAGSGMCVHEVSAPELRTAMREFDTARHEACCGECGESSC
jgi:hypothetical protein